MKTCPNAECRYRQRHGRPAEYQDAVTVCSDCGSELIAAPESKPEEAAPKKPKEPQGAGPWGGLAVSVACSVACVAAAFVPLPGTEHLLNSFGGLFSATSKLSLMAIGFAPVLSAYAVVELAAAVVPSWGRLRLSGREGRTVLRRWTIGLAALLAFVQAVGMANYLRDLGHRPWSGALAVQPFVPWAAVVLLPLGTLLFAVLSAVIDRWGLGDGLSVLLGATGAWAVLNGAFDAAFAASYAGTSPAYLVAWGVLIVWGSARMLGRKPPFRAEGGPFAIELPPCGLDPVAFAATLLALPATVAAWLGLRAPDLRNFGMGYDVLSLMLVASFGVALSLLYNQPRRVAEVWFGRDAQESQRGTARKVVAAATIRGVAFLLGLELLRRAPAYLNFALTFDLLALAVATAVVLDLAGEWRFRRGHKAVAGAWPIHRIYAVAPALQALEAAGIPAFPRGLHHRALLQFFGPYVPVTVLVPVEKAKQAEAIVRGRLLGEGSGPEAKSAAA